ncbi:Tat pathway signal sequence domain protein [Streptomyces sp. NPDC060000]|uniref:Tat pathway signal sequence domain protein n=1 Tax=Streptomyces sp. NPDC060000 TaxID=3347031 RepID=UPI00367B89EE
MSGTGPVEPGEGTHAWDTSDADRTTAATHTPGPADALDTDALDTDATTPAAPLLRRLARHHATHRRAASAALTAMLLLAGGGYLCATRPHDTERATPAPPFPSQVVDVTYLGQVAVPPGTRPRTFAFEVLLGVDSGPPVTVTRVAQPYAGLSLTSAPRAPFRTKAGSVRKVVITMHATECEKIPRDAGLPFIDVTLRNARAIQVHSYILGTHYAHDLSEALQVACSNDSGHHQNARDA